MSHCVSFRDSKTKYHIRSIDVIYSKLDKFNSEVYEGDIGLCYQHSSIAVERPLKFWIDDPVLLLKELLLDS